jgi:cytochrome d ubiquinol oxidase subunit I
MDEALLPARLQFALQISFHILFPAITVALGWFLFLVKWRYHRTGDEVWIAVYRLWAKIFALTFALGVVSGIVMSFQFGTNWPGFMERVGNVAGPLLAYEILTAFFLEATFLGVMLFGHRRVPEWAHTGATALVAVGTTMSAFWILVLNSWMHTPAGFELRNGVVHAVDWWAIVFNPSMPYRLAHVLLASALMVAFLVLGLSAWRWRRGDRGQDVWVSLRAAALAAAVLGPAQLVMGDLHGLNTLEHQPAKVAAMEGIWETERGASLRLFAIPDETARANRMEISIPYATSLILTHRWDGEVRGLNEFVGAHPPVAPVFWAFRVMVGVGMLMIGVGVWAAWSLWRCRSLSLPLSAVLVGMTFSGWVATLAGWYVTEIGRQPWLVTGVLRTAEALGPVPAGAVWMTLGLYGAVYVFLLVVYVTMLFRLAAGAGKAVAAPGGGAVPGLAAVPAGPEGR